jgi:phenylacetate-CoA ligase
LDEHVFYDELETREPAERDVALFAALRRQVERARDHAPAYAERLTGLDLAALNDWDALAKIPILRKSTLAEQQAVAPPFGGLATVAIGELARVFASPGPIYEPEARRRDYWRTARSLFAAGFRQGDLVHNAFSYHLTPAGAMLEAGAHALGCAVVPAGVGQTELQLDTIVQLRPHGYVGTPSFLKILLERARERAVDVASLRKALVSGEALPPSLRDLLHGYGVAVHQCYATADLGVIAYESAAKEGLIIDEGVMVEIVRPGTGDPVPEGEVGEVVVTTLNPDYPLIRFATGDLSAVLSGPSPCGRTNMRIEGWLGRADQTTKVRGLFVHPSQVADVCKRYPNMRKARVVVTQEAGLDVMTVYCEVEATGDSALAARIGETMREVCKLRAEVALVEVAHLPNDGKVIEDLREYK